jgi:transposase
LRNSENKLGEHCRRMKARLGKAEGIAATAHKLARILYGVITRREPYDEARAFQQSPATAARRLKNLKNQAAKLGFQLTPAM